MCSSLLAGSYLAIGMQQYRCSLATSFLLELDTTACLVTCLIHCQKSITNSEYKFV